MCNSSLFGCDAGETLIDRIDRAAECFPDNVAVVYKDKRYTYRTFADLTDRNAAHLRRAGVGRGMWCPY